MVSSYTSTGALPTLLSPTLPPQFESTHQLRKSDEEFEHEDDDEFQKLGDSDIDNMPMSLLSPTLPTMFSENLQKSDNSSALAHPLPKKLPSTVASVLSNGTHSKVRWINKLGHAEKPRFLLRISFALLTRYKTTFRAKSPAKVQGLGISEAKKPETNAEKTHWLKVAKDAQAHAEKIRARDPLLSVIVQFDGFLCLAIAHEYDKVKKLAWTSLYADVPAFVQRIEKYIKTHNVQDKKKAYLSFLVGVLSTIKALMLKRVNSALQSTAKDDTIADLHKIIENHTLMADHFAEAQTFFSNCPAPATIFPKSWHNRSVAPTTLQNTHLAPGSDKYYLPLGPYSDLRDGCAYLCCCLREILELYGSEMNGGVRYNLQCAPKRKP